jgi:ElaB/YqjD/DUF883 family membrane-anchored ribosome-binding protein
MDDRHPSAKTSPDRSNAGGDKKSELNRIREQSGSLADDAGKPAEDLATHASHAAGEVLEHAKTAATEVIDHATQAAGETVAAVATDVARRTPEIARSVRERAANAAEAAYVQGTEYASRNVRTYPLTTLLVAGAVGYGLGYIFSRQ